ncbi:MULTISPECIES: FRG domain-containing protein [unclassified Bradyrhizobium]|uniref:FRG domain-containing protein n=1 Tax=unclassified Bradyrhizobium TaxID=2631580 RepID=UPI0028E67A79|nr:MULTISPECIES: FRG domain-containing protein [unclassified Bradyrhizobium]
MPVIHKEVEGLAGLLTETLGIAEQLSPDSFLWFRGIANSNHSLLPKIMREGRSSDQVFERERRLLTRFRQRSMAYWPAGYPQSDWEHLFAMQHYGVPTRLLDWSENLFVAAHFALAASSTAEADHPPAIWCVDPIAWNRAMPVLSEYGDSIHVLTTSDEEIESYRPETTKRRNKSPVAIFGTHNSSRIVAQRGTFMVWGNDVRPLELFAAETEGLLWKLTIQGDKSRLSQDLATIGFRETMVFPELPALAVELSRTEGWRS